MKILLRVPILLLAASAILAVAPQQTPIRQIDFKNFTYPWTGEDAHRAYWHWMRLPQRKLTTFQLINGRHTFNEDAAETGGGPMPAIFFKSATYGDLLGERSEQAAVWLNYSTGGTANWQYLYVFTLNTSNGAAAKVPKLVGLLESGSRASGGLVRVSIENRRLILDFMDEARSVGDCCSEGYIRVHYVWRDGRFVETDLREHGDLKLNAL
jgi:hypothetical protein